MKENENKNKLEPVTDGNSSPLLPIESLIHVIRDQQVMLDSDLARLYGVETRVLNQAVKRNIERFPEDFMFQLTKEECLRSQIVTLNEGRGKHLKYMPYAFTEKLTRISIISDIPSKTSVRSCSLSQKWM